MQHFCKQCIQQYRCSNARRRIYPKKFQKVYRINWILSGGRTREERNRAARERESGARGVNKGKKKKAIQREHDKSLSNTSTTDATVLWVIAIAGVSRYS